MFILCLCFINRRRHVLTYERDKNVLFSASFPLRSRMPLGLFLVFSWSLAPDSQTSVTPLGLVSWVTVIYFASWRGREHRRSEMPLGLFLSCYASVRTGSSNTRVFCCSLFFSVVAYPRPPFFARPTNTCCNLSVNVSIFFCQLAPLRQNLHERRCIKVQGMQCNKSLFDESNDKDASKLWKFDRVTGTRAKQTRLNIHQ